MSTSRNISSRRGFLRRTSALTAAAAAGAAGAEDLVPAWMKQQGHPIIDPPYGQPSPFEFNVARIPFATRLLATANASLTPLQHLHGIITPSGLVFERHHGGVPDIPPDQHRLLVHGMTQRALSFTMEDLMRFPSVSRRYFLECSGNTLSEWKSRGETVQHTHGLLSCCEWTGVPLSIVLQEVGSDPMAQWILAEGADAAAMTRSIPMSVAMDDALLVYAQNGEMLRREQGYPLRLFLPGIEGNASVKWLRRLKLSDTPFMTREETSKYTDLMADGKARQFSLVMDVKSVIVRPSGGQEMAGSGFVEIQGLAWSGHGRIRRLEVSTDGGKSWRDAALQKPIQSKCLTAFRLPWRWDGSAAILQSRATDEKGNVQATRDALVAERGLNSFYHYSGIQSWHILPGGKVENIHV